MTLSRRLSPGLSLRVLGRFAFDEALLLDRHIREGEFQQSLALVAGLSGALSGLEVALQHYRGSYNQRVMITPVALSGAMFVAGLGGALHPKIARTWLPVASWALLGDGLLGFAFHIRGVNRKPGGFRIPIFNMVMGPPVFAPLLLGIGGFLGVIASNLTPERQGRRSSSIGPPWRSFRSVSAPWASVLRKVGIRRVEDEIRQGRFQKFLAGATVVSATLNGLESSYSHYKTNYAYKAQWVPVVLTPVIVAAASAAIVDPRASRTALPAASLLALGAGGIGTFFHARGVLRRPGGLRMVLYNLVYGPPLFAPLLFAATGFLGLLASRLRRES